MPVKVIVMVDRESQTGSVKVKLPSSVPVEIAFEGEVRQALPKEGMVEEDFYVLCTRLWQGQKNPELYEVKVDGTCYRFGLREIGLDSMRGFYLNGESYPLSEDTLRVVEATDGDELFAEADQSGLCLLVKVDSTQDVERLYNHPSIIGWVLPSGMEEKAMSERNKAFYREDKTRPTFFLVPSDMAEEDGRMKKADVNLFSGLEAEERAESYHKKFPYRCVGVIGGGRNRRRFHILSI